MQVPLESLVVISGDLHELATHLENAGYTRTAEQIRLRARALAGLTGPDVRAFLREQVERDRAGEQG